MHIAITYTLLALIAMAVNIGAQDLSTVVYGGTFAIPISVFVGTVVGLVVKYDLDKRFIFNFRANSVAHNGKTFVLYAAMGLVTTAVFWGFEWAFQHIFATKEMRFLGGAIGLAIGYWTKYHLDKRFVFGREAVA